MLTQNNELKKILQQEATKNDLQPILWRGYVVEIDNSGNKYPEKVKGSLKVRIPGLHNFIDIRDELDSLPVVLPFFAEAGFRPSIPQIGDQVFVMFEYVQPLGQAYWLTIVPGTIEERKSNKSITDIYKELFNIK